MKNICICATLVILFVSSCSDSRISETSAVKSDNEIGKAYFLVGNWQNTTPEGVLTETWSKQNDSVLAGQSYFITGKDTSFSETIKLEQRGYELFYIPSVKDQNGGLPIEFKLSAASPTRLIFENPAHDFPSKITYSLVTKDSLVAEISGSVNGKINTQQFLMKRSVNL